MRWLLDVELGDLSGLYERPRTSVALGLGSLRRMNPKSGMDGRRFKSWARFVFRTPLILLMFKCAEIECNPCASRCSRKSLVSGNACLQSIRTRHQT